MKNFLTTLFCLIILNSFSQEKTFKEFYKSHKKQADISLNIPGFLANIFVKKRDNQQLKTLLKKAKNYKILVYENSSKIVQNDFKKFIQQNNLKSFIKVKEVKEQIAVYFKEEKNNIKEIIINIFDKNKETVLIGLKTNLTSKELNTIINKSKV